MTINVTLGAPFADTDKRGARRRIASYNAKQPNDDDGNPTNQLPSGTDAELKASYEQLAEAHLEVVHQHEVDLASRETYVDDVKVKWRAATDAQRAAAIAALNA